MPKILYKEENGKFKSRYRIQSNRNQNWDYGDEGYYFITICTKDREEYFGKIKDGEIILNEIGKTVNQFWFEIPKHFPFVQFDEFIVMPNHVHGIVVIENHDIQRRDEALPRLYTGQYPKMSEISPKPKSLSVIIGSFKSICTKRINQQFQSDLFHFAWQPNYHDRIIRNEKELFNIRKYIEENLLRWGEDEYFKT